ncbi:MAG: SDR family oxidoreductase [Phycisphaerae bacterium]
MMAAQRWLVTGASGQLGGHVVRQLARETAGADILALALRSEVGTAGVRVARTDFADLDGLGKCVAEFRPTHIVHTGAVTAVGDCCARPEAATRVNTDATCVLAETAAGCQARLVFISTDMVFAGDEAPYRETDRPRPLSHYGRTKAAAERLLVGFERTLVVRLPLLYGFACTRRETTFAKQIAALRSGEPLRLFTDEYRTPVWLPDAAAALIGLARSELTGVIHVAGPKRLSRFEMVGRFARLLNVPDPKLEPASRHSIDASEPRPEDLSLDGARFAKLFPRLAPGPIRAEVFAAFDWTRSSRMRKFVRPGSSGRAAASARIPGCRSRRSWVLATRAAGPCPL